MCFEAGMMHFAAGVVCLKAGADPCPEHEAGAYAISTACQTVCKHSGLPKVGGQRKL